MFGRKNRPGLRGIALIAVLFLSLAAPALAAPPVPSFTANVTSGTAPLWVQFTDTSTGDPTNWLWDYDYPNGMLNQAPNPVGVYWEPGTHTVWFSPGNLDGDSEIMEYAYITVLPAEGAPMASFSTNETTGTAPLTVQFTDTSTNTPVSWTWQIFASGSNTDIYSINTQNMTYEFASAGTYLIAHTATNAQGSMFVHAPFVVNASPLPPLSAPVAAFTSDTATGGAPVTVQFTDLSTGSPTAWAWDFNGDAIADSTEQNPSYTYNIDGTYTVTLQVSNDAGTDLETKTDHIRIGSLTATRLKASFRYVVPGGSGGAGPAPLTIQFTDTTEANGTYSRYWSFGDGETSVEANPTHVYTTAGKYDPRLTVESDTRRSTESYAKVIQAYPVEAASPLPTNTYGAKMTQMMDSNWNLSVIGPLLPTPYTDLVPETLFWGLLWGGVFMIYFVRQGTSWLTALLGIIIGGNVLAFLPPEWAAAGQALLIVSVGAFFYVLIQGRIRSS